MKIALVSPTPVPPTYGGMDRLLEGLRDALNRRHPTDLITLPYDERTREGVVRGYYDFYNLNLDGYDRVISYKAPSYMVRHRNQVQYLSHRLRVFYDLYQPADADHEKLRDLIHFMDGWALDKQRLPHLFTVGETVSRRLIKYGNIASTPIHHPSTFRPKPVAEISEGKYFLSVGRLHPWKRVDLIIKAMLLSGAQCPLKIAGEGPHEAELRELAAGDPRIEFVGKVTDEELADLYADCIATIFPPVSEDMGLITFESFLSGRPLLTVTDAGEPALIVEEGKTGFVTEPTPEALAERIDWMWNHRDEARAMGEHCREWMKQVTWDRLVDALLAAGDDIDQSRQASEAEAGGNGATASFSISTERVSDEGKIKLLVTDNQIIDPPIGGGRVRILELYRHMPDDFTTTYIGAFDYPGPSFRDQQYTPNFREILTPLTAPHFKCHNLLARLTRGRATVDVTMPMLGGLTPRYRRLIDQYLPKADVLICAHPWMIPFLPGNISVPLVYDSQNCEALVKGPMLKGTLAGRYLARGVRRTEQRAVEESELVLACSPEDAQAFQSLYQTDPTKIMEAPNGVDCKVIQPADELTKRESRERLGIRKPRFVIFTGSNYLPNLEGAEFIILELAPNFPEVEFGIAGGVGIMFKERHPAQTVPGNVKLFGFVKFEELLDIYHAADAALNPMKQGSGTNIKMLDYMAAALPILTTSKGARGLQGRSGKHWIETDLDHFGSELRQLIDSNEKVREIGAKGRALAENVYDWSLISSRLAERLRSLVHSNTSRH